MKQRSQGTNPIIQRHSSKFLPPNGFCTKYTKKNKITNPRFRSRSLAQVDISRKAFKIWGSVKNNDAIFMFRLFELVAQHTQNSSNFTSRTLAGNLPVKKWTKMDRWPLNSWKRRGRGVTQSYLAHKGLQYSLRWEKIGSWMPAWYICTFRLNRSYPNCHEAGKDLQRETTVCAPHFFWPPSERQDLVHKSFLSSIPYFNNKDSPTLPEWGEQGTSSDSNHGHQ